MISCLNYVWLIVSRELCIKEPFVSSVCVCVCLCAPCVCVCTQLHSRPFSHSPGAFVWSEPIHLLTLASPASCMTIQAIKPRVEHTLFNSYHMKNRSKEDECLPSQGMKRGRECRRKRNEKKETRALSHNSDSPPHTKKTQKHTHTHQPHCSLSAILINWQVSW